MNILGNSIRQLRKQKKLTQKELAQLTGFKQNTISNHENGNRQLDETDIRTYANAFGVSPQYLFDLSKPPKPSPGSALANFDPKKAILLHNYSKLDGNRQNRLLATSEALLAEQKGKTQAVIDINEKRAEYDARKRVSLPVPGKVSAGSGYWQEDDYDTMVDFYADDLPDEGDYDTIAKVKGNSMLPVMADGDYLFIKLTSSVDANTIGIFQVDGENYVKKLRYSPDYRFYLESLNPDYDDIYLHEDSDIRTIGEVVEIYREN